MTPRLYLEPPCPASHTLDARRSHHLVRVLRIRDGDSIELFDGTGAVWSAQGDLRRGARVQDRTRSSHRPGRAPLSRNPPRPGIAEKRRNGSAASTGDGTGRCSHLAAGQRAHPVQRTRGGGRFAHWRRIIIAACEQSRRTHLPRLHDLRPFGDFIGAARTGRALLLHPGAQAMPRELPIASTTILIGPEGGWTDEEAHQAARSGNRCLRTRGLGCCGRKPHRWPHSLRSATAGDGASSPHGAVMARTESE